MNRATAITGCVLAVAAGSLLAGCGSSASGGAATVRAAASTAPPADLPAWATTCLSGKGYSEAAAQPASGAVSLARAEQIATNVHPGFFPGHLQGGAFASGHAPSSAVGSTESEASRILGGTNYLVAFGGFSVADPGGSSALGKGLPLLTRAVAVVNPNGLSQLVVFCR